MPKPQNTIRSKKDSGAQGDTTPGRKKPNAPPQRKRAGGTGGNDDDSDSVDSRGNLKGFIVATDEEEEEPPLRPRRTRAKPATKPKKESSSESEIISPKKKPKVVTESSEESAESPSPSPKKRSGGFKPKRRIVPEPVISEEEEEEEDEDDYDDDDEDDDDEEEESEWNEDDEDEEDDGQPRRHEISINFGGMTQPQSDHLVPKRHNMKKESEAVKRFFKLITEPQDDGGIDDQIDQFKSLTADKQRQLITSLENRPSSAQENLMFKILTMNLTPETRSVILAKYNALQSMDPGAGEYYKHRAWLEKVTSLPLGVYKEMPVRLDDGPDLCGAFMEKARKSMSDSIYGQEASKLQILQFIAGKIANPTSRGLSLLLIGPPGIGKTSLIKNGIAKALEWPFQFISLGGDSDATTYTGHQLVYEGSHAGKIVNSLAAAKSMSMILMFDELDKISATPKGEEVQNLLVHMTDSVQNCDFEDKYLSGIPLDLSRTMFIFSGNDITKIDKVLLDRMVVIHLEGYEKKDKMEIAELYLLPTALKDVSLTEKVSISKEVLEHVITEYAGTEPGVRELKRCLEQIAQKINMLRMFNTKDLPFHIPDFQLPFIVKKSHVDLFLKKTKPKVDISVERMYS
jgi:flagellar biosynthesis GTPase FlhF